MRFTEQFPKILFGIVITLIILVIINIYLIDNGHIHTSNSYNPDDENATLVESLYFSITTLSTVGYGDILPKSQFGKIIVTLEHLFILSILFGGISYGSNI
jgi:hypothetical protein